MSYNAFCIAGLTCEILSKFSWIVTGQFQFSKINAPLGSQGSIEVVIHDLYDDDGDGFQSDPVNTRGCQWVQWIPMQPWAPRSPWPSYSTTSLDC